MKSSFISRQKIMGDIWSYKLKRPDNYDFIAGQFMELSVKDNHNKIHKRWFTLSSSPDEKYLEIITRIPKANLSTFKITLSRMKINEGVDISDVMGDFVLPRNKNYSILFIGIGIGVTPFISMLRSIKTTQKPSNIDMFFLKGRDNKELIFKELFTENCAIVMEDKYSEDKSMLINSLDTLTQKRDLIYISGPEKKVEKIRDLLIDIGVNSHKIIADYFPGY